MLIPAKKRAFVRVSAGIIKKLSQMETRDTARQIVPELVKLNIIFW